ncbi:MAG: K(+)-transporting ATPase subunit F [Blastocatellia bacterium]
MNSESVFCLAAAALLFAYLLVALLRPEKF